jgi:predicted ABC-type ATPase
MSDPAPPRPTVYVIAGANGAGKTTFARRFLPVYCDCREFINPDLIAAGLSPFDPAGAAVEAGRIMLRRFDELSAAGKTFAFETTFGGTFYAAKLRRLIAAGYGVRIFFLWLPAAELNIERVALRVSRGGHDVAEADIRRRFRASVRNFLNVFRPLAERWYVFDNSATAPRLVAQSAGGGVSIILETEWAAFQRVGAADEDDARGNPPDAGS